MKKINRKVLCPVKHNSVLYLTSEDDNIKTSSFWIKYFIDWNIIGAVFSYSSIL